MINFVYQLSVRKPDNELKKIRVETDTIFTEIKLEEKDIQKISIDNECDVIVQFLGELHSPENLENYEEKFYSKEDLEKIIAEWKAEE